MRKSIIYLLAAATLAAGGIAQAQNSGDAPRGPQGDMTRAQAEARATAMFQRLDVNHDGKLDQADRVAREHEMFDKLDTDHNGSLSFDEFEAAHRKMEQRGGHHGDRHGRRGGGHMHPPGGMDNMHAMMQQADTNHDGAISQAEFVNFAMQRFDAMDANHDGTVTRAERRAYMQAHGGGHWGPPPPPPADGQ